MKRTAGVLVAGLVLFILAMALDFNTPQAGSAKSSPDPHHAPSLKPKPQKPAAVSPQPTPPATPGEADKVTRSRAGKPESKPVSRGQRDTEITESEQNDEGDPDLPPGSGDVDKESYLQQRSQHIAMLRGVEAGKPFDLALRNRAIKQMEQQEAELSGANSFLGKIAKI